MASLSPLGKDDAASRALANPELFGALWLEAAQHGAAARTFLSFEAYMDTALHDPDWGYYSRTAC